MKRRDTESTVAMVLSYTALALGVVVAMVLIYQWVAEEFV